MNTPKKSPTINRTTSSPLVSVSSPSPDVASAPAVPSSVATATPSFSSVFTKGIRSNIGTSSSSVIGETPPLSNIGTSSIPSISHEHEDLISTLGICGVIGYEAEVNQCIGLNKMARTDTNIINTVAKLNTRKYILRKRHRLQFLAMYGYAETLQLYFNNTSPETIASLRTIRNNTLYHLVSEVPYKSSDPRIADRVKIIHMLAKTKLDMNAMNDEGVTALMKAANTNNDLVKAFLQYPDKVNVNAVNSGGDTVLSIAISRNKLAVVRTLLEKSTIDLNIRDNYGRTAFFEAVTSGNVEMVDEFLKYQDRFDINSVDNYGENAFATLLSYRHRRIYDSQIIHRLCQSNMDMNLRNPEGNSVIHVATHRQYWALRTILTYPDRFDINSQNNLGNNALHSAIQSSLYSVRMLCANSQIDMNMKNNNGQIPLLMACREGGIGMVSTIFSKGKYRFLMNSTDNSGNSALHSAIYNRRSRTAVRIIRILHKKGISMKIRNNSGDDALSLAIQRRATPIIMELLSTRIFPSLNLNSQNNAGNTALHIAVENDLLDIVERLCNISTTNKALLNNAGETPRAIAVRKNNTAIINELTRFTPV